MLHLRLTRDFTVFSVSQLTVLAFEHPGSTHGYKLTCEMYWADLEKRFDTGRTSTQGKFDTGAFIALIYLPWDLGLEQRFDSGESSRHESSTHRTLTVIRKEYGRIRKEYLGIMKNNKGIIKIN